MKNQNKFLSIIQATLMPFKEFTKQAWLLIIMFFLLAFNANAQEKKISIKATNKSLSEILNQIESKTSYSFLVRSNDVDLKQIISIDVTNKSINEVLTVLFKNNEINFEITGKSISIFIPQKPQIKTNAAGGIIKASGIISDSNGLPIIGASINIQGTSKGTISDMDGKFTLEVPANSILKVTCIGFLSKEITVNNQRDHKIILSEDLKVLDEVVVVGYGTQKKRNVTGAVSIVKADDLSFAATSNFAQALQGRAPGVQVIQATGQPGAGVSIQLRSNPSNANAGVLYVVDGVPINDNAGTPSSAKYGSSGVDQSPLNFINPEDIETISFLKDASSASIYGARAGAGVVLITTKRGKSGIPKVTFTSSYGIQNADKVIQLLDTKNYIKQANLVKQELWMRDNKIAPYYGTTNASTVTPYNPRYSQSDIDNTPVLPNAMDAIFSQGYIEQHNLSITGGNDKTSYFLSGNYFDQKGILINSGIKRYNGKINFDQVISNSIKMGTSIIVSNSNTQNSNTGGSYENGGVVTAAIYHPGNLPLRDVHGNYTVNPRYTNIPNPLSYETVTDFTDGKRLLTNAYAEWQIIKGLTAKGNFSYDQSSNKRNSFYPTTFLYGMQVNGLASINQTESNTNLTEWTLNYKSTFLKEKLALNVLAGYSTQVTNWAGQNSGNQNFVSDAISYYNLGAGQAITPVVGSYKSQQQWASYFARTSFIYDSKYILQASIRRDGSSTFAENKKWGRFPSVSASWVASEEHFIKSIGYISDLKLRAGYGETGNSSFGGSAFEVYSVESWASPYFGTNSLSSAFLLSQAANPNLTWETAGEFNVGLDLGLFNNRILTSVDLFSKTIRNLITQIPLPADNIVSSVWGNAGTTRSEGYDIGLTTRNFVASKKGDFTWTTTVNFSHYLNYWVERSAASLATLPKYVAATGRDAVYNGYYGYQADGIFKGEFGTAPATMPGMNPGGIIIKDIHGYDAKGNLTAADGKINGADQTLLFNWDPKYNVGFGNEFTYKNFDLNIFFSGIVKKGLSPENQNVESLDTYGWNQFKSTSNRWTYQNPTATQPTGISDVVYGQYQGNTNYWVVDASYIRCKNITFGYTFPDTILGSNKTISSLKLFVDLQNMFTITSYPGLDPELSQGNFYPYSKSCTVGLNITF